MLYKISKTWFIFFLVVLALLSQDFYNNALFLCPEEMLGFKTHRPKTGKKKKILIVSVSTVTIICQSLL